MPYEIERRGYCFESKHDTAYLPVSVVGSAPLGGDGVWTADGEAGETLSAWLESVKMYLPFHGDVIEVRALNGYFGRWIMGSGYLDCSDWSYCESEKALIDTLNEFYGDDDDVDDEE